jgi:hypothetical protein
MAFSMKRSAFMAMISMPESQDLRFTVTASPLAVTQTMAECGREILSGDLNMRTT